MGEVFRAVDTRLHRTVAIKLLRGRALADAVTRERFQREARAASALNHPHICTVHDVGEADGQPYLVMEYLEGETLRERLSQGPLPLAQLFDIAVHVADALDAAHSHGILHRDIKPANIFITRRGQAKILDFGIAKAAGGHASDETTEAGPATLTEVGIALGTIAYMSPEQARGEPLDSRTDLYSCGVVLYEMASGERPLRGATDALLFDAILNHEPAPLGTVRPDVPAAFEQLVTQLLAKQRNARIPSARELLRVLKEIRQGTEPGARQAPLGARPVRKRGTSRWTAAAALAVAASSGFAYWRLTPPPMPPIHSLAVLPFDNQVGGASNEVLEGLTDALTADLALLPTVDLVPRTLMDAYQGTAKSAQEVGRELKADAVLLGVVTGSQDSFRLVARLLETAEGRTLWSETYQRGQTGLFELQKELTADVGRAIGVATPAQTTTAASEAPQVNPRAYDLYLRARYHAGRLSAPELDEAIGLLEQSTTIDPAFGPAQALLGVAYTNKAVNYRPNDPQWRDKGYAAVEKALALDQRSPDAHFARGDRRHRISRSEPSGRGVGAGSPATTPACPGSRSGLGSDIAARPGRRGPLDARRRWWIRVGEQGHSLDCRGGRVRSACGRISTGAAMGTAKRRRPPRALGSGPYFGQCIRECRLGRPRGTHLSGLRRGAPEIGENLEVQTRHEKRRADTVCHGCPYSTGADPVVIHATSRGSHRE